MSLNTIIFCKKCHRKTEISIKELSPITSLKTKVLEETSIQKVHTFILVKGYLGFESLKLSCYNGNLAGFCADK